MFATRGEAVERTPSEPEPVAPVSSTPDMVLEGVLGPIPAQSRRAAAQRAWVRIQRVPRDRAKYANQRRWAFDPIDPPTGITRGLG